ncbi:MAG: signal peptidase I, partial [Terrimicrobiaceae bacterium]|nr:signal peptidase I [Terrimicrobiaceae bacterium]
MLFLTPRYLKEARHYRHALKRVINYRRDILAPADLEALEELLDRLRMAIRQRSREACSRAQKEIDRVIGRVAPPPPHAGLRENVEVFVVAIVIAAGVRAYLLQPFRIPTGSMQPTLYGVVGTPTGSPPPNPLVRAWDLAIRGRAHLNIVAEADGTVAALRERTHLNFFTFTDIVMEGGKTYTAFAPRAPLVKAFGAVPGRQYCEGEPIARGVMDTGDQVFVDKMSYHFFPPRRGEVFVFKTTGIRAIEAGLPAGVQSQHYIKRLAGLPGDTLRIAAPDLLINGSLPSEWTLLRVIAARNGYRGYANIPAFPFLSSPDATFTVPQNTYFALGDNSYHSSDSRFWGAVPKNNLTGRGFWVYWTFT